MQITIRPVAETDFPQLIELFREFAFFEQVPERMQNSLEQMLAEQEWLKAFVAENEQGKVVGYATYFVAYYTWIGKCLYMDDLYVQPDWRGSRIGTRLLNRVIDFARETNCRKLRWQVSDWNEPAREFYRKVGAEIDTIERNCDLVFHSFKSL